MRGRAAIRHLGWIAAVSTAPVAAQTAPPGDVVVTGRGLSDDPAAGTLGQVTLDRAQVTQTGSNRLDAVLDRVAGLTQFRRSDARSANPTSQGVTLRGLGGNAASRALLTLDGVPQADPFGGWVAFPAYATGRLGRVTVTRGGGSAYRGPGALAGTIALESVSGDDLAPASARVFYGSRDAIDAQAGVALRRDAGFLTFDAAYARGDGFIPIVAEDRGPIDRGARYEQASASVRGVVQAGGTEIQTNLTAFTDARDRGLPFTNNLSQGADASVRVVGRGAWRFEALAYLQTRAFASSFVSIDDARTRATQVLDQFNVPATGIGGRIELAPPEVVGIALRLGGDVRALSGRTRERYTFVGDAPTRLREAGGRSITFGGFVDARAMLGPVAVTATGRIDGWRIDNGFLSERTIATGAPLTGLRFADRRGSEATWRGGAAWDVTPTIALRASGYTGWRLPTLNELYRPFRVGADATGANALLRPERLSGAEGGATWHPDPAFTLAATGFSNRLDDVIANVTVARGPGQFPGVGFVSAAGVYRQRRNLDAIRADGVEVEAGWRGAIWGARLAYTHTDPRAVASGAAAGLDGLRPAQTPRDTAVATIDWHRDALAAAVTLRHVASQFEDDQNLRRLAPATTIDAFVALPLGRTLRIEARGENLFDARVEAGISGDDLVERATPRTLWIGLAYRP